MVERKGKVWKEYHIDEEVDIGQHKCVPGKVGVKGKLTSLFPLRAKCNDCGLDVAVITSVPD